MRIKNKMGYRYNISLKEGYKDLADWINEMKRKGELEISDIFRDAVLQKKAEWEAMQPDALEGLKAKNIMLKKEVARKETLLEFTHGFIDQLKKEDRDRFWDSWKEKVTELRELNGKEVPIQEIVEVKDE